MTFRVVPKTRGNNHTRLCAWEYNAKHCWNKRGHRAVFMHGTTIVFFMAVVAGSMPVAQLWHVLCDNTLKKGENDFV